MTAKVIGLVVPPGIQRDGTQFDSAQYVDGKWVRFQRGRPRKIGGYRAMFLNATGISRGMSMTSSNGFNYIVSGYSAGIQQWQTSNTDGLGSGPVDLSLPGSFSANAANLWQFDIGYNSTGGATNNLVAHAGVNLSNIDNIANTPVFYGQFPGGTLSKVGVFTVTAALNSTTTITVSTVDARIFPGQTVTGSNIPANTTVVSSTLGASTTTVVLNNAATATVGSQSVTFDNNIAVSGGCVVLHPYLFVYGNNGLIQNCSAGDYSNWHAADANANNVATGKIVKGLPVRGGTTSPSGLFWALDALIRVSFAPQTVGSSQIYWTYDVVSAQTSIMSSQSVIEYDGIFYWCGTDRFLMYNGVVKEVDNQQNMNWFFDNINYAQRQKVWATKIPRWGEIWWFYPRGRNATECNDAIIYNIREQKWYDAGLAEGAARSAGTFSEVFRYPIMGGTTPTADGTYVLWQHETGTDRVYLNDQTAIDSYFETNNIGWVTGNPAQKSPVGDNRWIRIERVEPDFVQSGTMQLYVSGKGYADDTDVTTGPYNFDPTTLKVDVREQRREMRLRFESNVVGGNYEMGNVLISADVGDERGTGNP